MAPTIISIYIVTVIRNNKPETIAVFSSLFLLIPKINRLKGEDNLKLTKINISPIKSIILRSIRFTGGNHIILVLFKPNNSKL